jgi:GDPmannose 4,6-dehydratase
LRWEGEGADEKGVDAASGRTLIEVDARYLRPLELRALIGDAAKAKELLGWQARTEFEELIRIMVEADVQATAEGR